MSWGIHHRRIRTVAATVVAGVLLLGACGSGKGSDGVTLSSVGAETAKAKSARIAFGLEFEGATVSMEGEFAFDTQYARMTMRSTGAGVPSAAFVYGGKESYFGPIDAPASGPRWVRLEGDDAKLGGDDLDPEQILADLKDSGAELSKTGTGTVHDDATTVYTFHITGDKGDKKNDFNTYGESNGTVEVGKDGRLRRLVLTPLHPTPADKVNNSDEATPKKLTFEIWDYGVNVDLSVDQSRVVDSNDPAAQSLVEQVFPGGSE